jgi:ATP-dependent DNA ligase
MNTYTMTFNTGRLYTKRGQIITAQYDDVTGLIRFNDHSRMITGQIIAPSNIPQNIETYMDRHRFAKIVMRNYDNGGYGYTSAELEELEEYETYYL